MEPIHEKNILKMFYNTPNYMLKQSMKYTILNRLSDILDKEENDLKVLVMQLSDDDSFNSYDKSYLITNDNLGYFDELLEAMINTHPNSKFNFALINEYDSEEFDEDMLNDNMVESFNHIFDEWEQYADSFYAPSIDNDTFEGTQYMKDLLDNCIRAYFHESGDVRGKYEKFNSDFYSQNSEYYENVDIPQDDNLFKEYNEDEQNPYYSDAYAEYENKQAQRDFINSEEIEEMFDVKVPGHTREYYDGHDNEYNDESYDDDELDF